MSFPPCSSLLFAVRRRVVPAVVHVSYLYVGLTRPERGGHRSPIPAECRPDPNQAQPEPTVPSPTQAACPCPCPFHHKQGGRTDGDRIVETLIKWWWHATDTGRSQGPGRSTRPFTLPNCPRLPDCPAALAFAARQQPAAGMSCHDAGAFYLSMLCDASVHAPRASMCMCRRLAPLTAA